MIELYLVGTYFFKLLGVLSEGGLEVAGYMVATLAGGHCMVTVEVSWERVLWVDRLSMSPGELSMNGTPQAPLFLGWFTPLQCHFPNI